MSKEPTRHANGGLKVYFPWTIVTAFGPIQHGLAGDHWCPLWNGPRGAASAARKANAPFSSTVFAAPLPEIGDQIGAGT
jgi:hypothetical protein